MTEEVSESCFYMWRAVVAMVHADGVVTPHEVSFVNDYVKERPFSSEQLDIIADDIRDPQSVYDMFLQITDNQDKRDFFTLARALSWCDGDYDAQEKLIIETLEKGEGFSEDIIFLKQSREFLNEITLNRNQWKEKGDKQNGVLGFIAGLKSQTA